MRATHKQQSWIDASQQNFLAAGQGFLDQICKAVLQQYGPQVVIVGSLRVAEIERMYIRTIASRRHDANLEHYDLCLAPCKTVIKEQRIVIHLQDLHRLFPNDPGIRLFRSRSYVGCPLLDSNSDSIGIMVAEWDHPINESLADEVASEFSRLAPRATEVISNSINSDALNILTSIPSRDENRDDDIFSVVAHHAASVAQVKAALVAECCQEDQDYFRILALASDGKLRHDLEGAVLKYEASPCGDLKTDEHAFIARGLRYYFPDVELFQNESFESYYGVAFRNDKGTAIGHLALLHNRPLSRRVRHSKALNAVAERAKQELRRHQAIQRSKSLEDVLRVRSKLESLGLMAGSIAHDFNNKLAAIIANTEYAQMQLPQDSSVARTLEAAEASMWQARDLVAELLEFAGNTPKSDSVVVDLNELIHSTLPDLLTKKPSTCELLVSTEETLPGIAARPVQMTQVLENAVLNAMEAMQDRTGTILIRTCLTQITREETRRSLTEISDGEHGENRVLLEIADDGPGIPANVLEKVFDPFFSTKSSGRGLGMAGILGIARRLGAGLTLQSDVNIGTTLRLYLPPVRPPDHYALSPASVYAVPVNRPAKGSVLVIDDDPNVLQAVALQIESLGYHTTIASSGEIALRKFADIQFRAVVVDVQMPDMDGWSTLRALRQQRGRLPAVVMSGFNQSNDQARLELDQDLRVLTKPFGIDELSLSLDELLLSN